MLDAILNFTNERLSRITHDSSTMSGHYVLLKFFRPCRVVLGMRLVKDPHTFVVKHRDPRTNEKSLGEFWDFLAIFRQDGGSRIDFWDPGWPGFWGLGLFRGSGPDLAKSARFLDPGSGGSRGGPEGSKRDSGALGGQTGDSGQKSQK